MSNNIRKLLNIKDPNILISENGVETIDNSVHVQAILTYDVDQCPHCCVSGMIVKNGNRTSRLTWLNASGQKCYLHLKKQRYLCKDCRQSFTAETQIVDRHCFVAKPVKQFIASQATETLSESYIARMANVSSHTVRRVIEEIASVIRKRPTTLPVHLSFDEFKSTNSVNAAMSFIFCDADSHQVVDIVQDRRLYSLTNYFYRYDRQERGKVQTITIDMYPPYIQLIKRLFSKAEIIIDRFHIVQALNREITRCRVHVMKEIRYKNPRLYNKYKRYWKLLLKDEANLKYTSYDKFPLFDNLTNTGNIVEYLIQQDQTLLYTYRAVQTLRHALKKSSWKQFIITLHQALQTPIFSGLRRVLKTFRKLSPYIENTFKYPHLTNGAIEGINNKIKVLKRVAYGYRNYSHFRDRILLISRLYVSGTNKEETRQKYAA